MAGYDAEFIVATALQRDAADLTRFFQRAARGLGLVVGVTRRDSTFRLVVDGPLPAMQHLAREFRRAVGYWVLAHPRPKSAARIAAQFVHANDGGVRRITTSVFRLVETFSRHHNGARPSELVVSSAGQDAATRGRPRRNDARIMQRIVAVLDGLLTRRMTPEDATVVCDQAVESWLRSELRGRVDRRTAFPSLLAEAVVVGLMSKRGSANVLRYHRMRNRVQHRGGRAQKPAVLRMLDCSIEVVERRHRVRGGPKGSIVQ